MNVTSTNRFGGMKVATTSRTVEDVAPNWNLIPSANMSTLSKKEIVDQVKELAGQTAKATTDKEKDAIQDKVQELYTQYESFVSPDRKSLYEQALKTIAQDSGNKKNEYSAATPPKTLLDFLNEHDGIGKKFDKTYQMSGGGRITAHNVTGGGFIFDIGEAGRNVMSINVGRIYGNGVYYTPTPAEQAATKEISNIYYKAIDYAKAFPSSTNDVQNTAHNQIDVLI
jgi:hypothetical protein